jgi:hypothetical protein
MTDKIVIEFNRSALEGFIECIEDGDGTEHPVYVLLREAVGNKE